MPEIENQIEVRIPTPILDTINRSLSKLFRKNLTELENDVNRAIELGVVTDETARDADIVSDDGHKALRIVNEIRLQYTRPIDEGKKALMREVESLLRRLLEGLGILDELRFERAAKIKTKKEEARLKAEEEKRAADEARQKEIDKRKKLREAAEQRGFKVGTDAIEERVPQVETPVRPIEQIGMRSTTRMRMNVDRDAIAKVVKNGVREIPGVHIYQVWTFDIVEASQVPETYRKPGRG